VGRTNFFSNILKSLFFGFGGLLTDFKNAYKFFTTVKKFYSPKEGGVVVIGWS
jgi:hypothetical protein